MIVIEQTHWPLVVVGTIAERAAAERSADLQTEPECRWDSEDLRLALVIRGDHTHAWVAQAEIFAWLTAHRARLWWCASRVAWIVEDDLMRRSSERWLTLIGGQLFRADTMTFPNARTAIAWLVYDGARTERVNP